ncbi:MAG: alkylation response protein AidB-like acyl-CoA dehydrogenase [Gammaproteobacteria bacterium]|jgi:alkylation response protein AidB-like acyl-CoA dehydrogenase
MSAFSSDERQLLHDSVQDYFTNQYSFEHFRSLSSAQHPDGYSRAQWSQYGELGWLGVALPEAAGGSSGGITELGIVMAAAGGSLALEPFLQTVVLGARAIELVGTTDQQALLSDVAVGSHTLAFCHAEPDAGYARDYVTALATPSAGGYSIQGEKSFTLHAQAADTLIVSARIGNQSGPVGLFLVPGTTDGVERRLAPALDERRGAALRLTNVAVGKDAKLGASEDDALVAIDQILDRGVAALCAEAAGAMAAVTDQTVEYLKTREQFGKPLSTFQVLQHRLVDMSIASEEARAATHGALTALDAGDPHAQLKVWRAKVQTARSARFVGGQAIQLHGGMGMTDELAIGHYYKRLTMCETMLGDGQWYLKQLAACATETA